MSRLSTENKDARTPVAETTVDIDLEGDDTPTSYTSETVAPTGRGQSITAPANALGRRKEAIARVRLVPGTGQWKVNGRTLEDYFPNKVHQQLVNSPFKLVDVEGRFDVVARITGGGVSGPVQSKSVGSVSVSYAAPTQSGGATWDFFRGTPYGQLYWSMLQGRRGAFFV